MQIPADLARQLQVRATATGTSLEDTMLRCLEHGLKWEPRNPARKRGGRTRAQNLTPERRAEIARLGGYAKADARKDQ